MIRPYRDTNTTRQSDVNNNDRRTLNAALASMDEIRDRVSSLRSIVSAIRDEDQSRYDDMSERRRDGDAGEALQSDISMLEEALEAIDGLDLKQVADKLVHAADADVPDISEAALGQKEIERRRWKRLAPWAQKTITDLRADLGKAVARAADMFAEPKGVHGELAIHDYGDLHGRILPTRTIMVPELAIQISIDKHGRGLMIRGDRSIIVMPEASNTVHILPKDGF